MHASDTHLLSFTARGRQRTHRSPVTVEDITAIDCADIRTFVLAPAVIHLRGGRGRDALRRAYVATFGRGDHVTP
ncbi:hypothetical protein GCM10018966_098010 [Streptomyces yanii]